jgi:hypothetical protein
MSNRHDERQRALPLPSSAPWSPTTKGSTHHGAQPGVELCGRPGDATRRDARGVHWAIHPAPAHHAYTRRYVKVSDSPPLLRRLRIAWRSPRSILHSLAGDLPA